MSGAPDPKPARAVVADDRQARLDFRVAVLALDRGCVIHDDPLDCEGPLAAHHVITQQQLVKAGRADLLWDARNGATACYRAHRRHHSGLQRMPLVQLPQRCLDFAREHGFEGVLDRYYDTTL